MNALRIFVASALISVLAACEAPSSGVDEPDLDAAAKQLQSLAGEAQWLAQQLEAGDVTLGFAWVHQQSLGEDTAKVARDLARPAPARLRDRHAQLLALAAQLEARVGRIAPAAADRGELESLRRELRGIAQAAQPAGAQG